MNEEKSNNNPVPSAPATPNTNPAVNSPQSSPSNTMQDVVQQMLPDDIRKQFVLQKNSPGMVQPNGETTPTQPTNPSKPPFAQTDSKFVQKPIRTFESDLAEALANKQGSVASIAIAESKRREEESRKQELLKKSQQGQIQGQGVAPTANPQRTTINRTSAIPSYNPAPNVPPSPMPEMPSQPVIQKQTIVQTPIVPASAPAMTTPPAQEEPPRHFPMKQILLGFASLAFIGGALSIGYYFYSQGTFDTEPVAVAPQIVIPSLIPTDKQVTVLTEGKTDSQLITALYASLGNNELPPGNSIELLLYEGQNGTAGNRVTGSSFMQKLGVSMPDVIARSLTDRWMFGAYTEETGSKTSFLALTTDFFQNAFAGMLIWEQEGMADDLALLLNFKERARREELNATSSIASYFTIVGDYSDKVIRNRDVREFRKRDGELLFLYSFINKETLVITTSESAFMALIDRIEKDIYVR